LVRAIRLFLWLFLGPADSVWFGLNEQQIVFHTPINCTLWILFYF
jgi:hypothetical protein